MSIYNKSSLIDFHLKASLNFFYSSLLIELHESMKGKIIKN